MILKGFVEVRTGDPIKVFNIARELSVPLEVSTYGECSSTLDVPSRTFREFLLKISPLIVPFEKNGEKALVWGYIQITLPSERAEDVVKVLTAHNCSFRLDWDKEETFLTIDPDKITEKNAVKVLNSILQELERLAGEIDACKELK